MANQENKALFSLTPDLPMLNAKSHDIVTKLTSVTRECLQQRIAETASTSSLGGLSTEFCHSLLWEPETLTATTLLQRWNYKPALLALYWVLEAWYQSGVLPQSSFCVPGVVELVWDKTAALQSYQTCRRAVLEGHCNDLQECIMNLLSCLGKSGILNLLGHRSTVGSIDSLCPPISTLQTAFEKPHCEGSTLTVGGRALTKHCHRTDHSSSFWPQPTGNDAHKNALALRVLNIILDKPVWINVHVVPAGFGEQLPIVEIRHVQGYGARWSADGTIFRGFLEPVSPFYNDKSK